MKKNYNYWKKLILVIICLGALLLLPFDCLAKEYSLSDTDISIDVPDDWFVFTRENIKDNPLLGELNIDYEYIKNVFENNYAYLDAFIFYEDGNSLEMFVRVKENKAITNLSNYSDDNVMTVSKELAKKQGHNNYDIYVEDYKFTVGKYKDGNFNLIEYYTIVNGYGYTITIQKPIDYTESEEQLIKSIIDTIKFDVDLSLKEPTENKDFDSFIDWVIRGGIIGAVVGGVSGLIIALIKKKKKNDSV